MAGLGKTLTLRQPMKSLLVLLLLVSVASGVAYLSWPRPPASPVTRVPVPARPVPEASSPSRPAWFRELPPREKFATPWAALAAGDHAGFVTLLREAGCPEETVRAFAIAAIGRRQQEQVEAPMREAIRNSKYWQLGSWEAADTGEPLSQKINRARAALDQELAQLLGVSAAELRRAYRTWGNDEPSVVPEAQQTAFAELSARHEAERSANEATLVRGAYGQLLDPGARTQLRDLRERQRRELAELLGPDLAAQHELRSSPEADYVRNALPAAKDEEEFGRLVAAAQAVGVDREDANAEQLRQHVPASARGSFPSTRDEVLARFRDTADPERLAEIEREQAEAQRQEEERQQAQREEANLNELAGIARAGGVELSDVEVRDLAAAIKRRGAELDREWGEPPAKPTPAETAALMEKLRVELERVAVATVGEKGRAIVAEMVRQQQPRQP